MRTDLVVVVAALALSALLGATGASAAHGSAPNPKGKQLYLDGKKAYDDGKYDEALTDFQQAYAVDARPAFWFNIGECQRKLGKTSDALKSYQKYLQGVPRAKNRDEVKKIIAELKAQAKAQGSGGGAKSGAASTTVAGADASAASTTPSGTDATSGSPDAAAATTTATSGDAGNPSATAPSTSGDAGAPGEGVPAWAYVAGGTAAAVAVAAVVGVVTVQALTAPSLGRLDLTNRQGATQ